MKEHPSGLLEVECAYTGCGAKPGEVCTNARTGKPMPHGHPERRREAKERAREEEESR